MKVIIDILTYLGSCEVYHSLNQIRYFLNEKGARLKVLAPFSVFPDLLVKLSQPRV